MQDLVPEEPIEWLPEKNLIKFYSYLKIKNFCCNRAYKISDDFEIAIQLFQGYAESAGVSLYFQNFGQELKIYSLQYCSFRVMFSSYEVQIILCLLHRFASGKIFGMLIEKSLWKARILREKFWAGLWPEKSVKLGIEIIWIKMQPAILRS